MKTHIIIHNSIWVWFTLKTNSWIRWFFRFFQSLFFYKDDCDYVKLKIWILTSNFRIEHQCIEFCEEFLCEKWLIDLDMIFINFRFSESLLVRICVNSIFFDREFSFICRFRSFNARMLKRLLLCSINYVWKISRLLIRK